MINRIHLIGSTLLIVAAILFVCGLIAYGDMAEFIAILAIPITIFAVAFLAAPINNKPTECKECESKKDK